MTVTPSSGEPHAEGAAESHFRLLLYAVLAALAARLVVVAFVYPSFLDPQREHWLFGFEIGKIAESIVLGHGYGNPFFGGRSGPTALVPPVMPYILAGVFKLFGVYTKASAIVILSLESLFSSLTCIPVFFVARKSFGIRPARWAVWVWAFFPYAIYFSADLIHDTALLTLLLTCIFWAALCLQDSARGWAWAGFGVLCGVAALTDPSVLSVVPFLAAWACFRLYKRGRRWLGPAIISAVVFCAVISPWLIRNYMVFHQPVFIRDGFALELCVGNVGNTLHWWNGLAQPSGSAKERAEFDRLGEQGYMAAKWVEARNYIESHPGIFLWRSVRRVIYLWTGYWSFNPKYLREEPFDPANIPLCLGMTILVVIGFRKMLAKDALKIVPYAILIVFFPLVYYITHPDLEYRQPINPELVILACCAIVYWRSASRKAAEDEPEPAAVSGAK